MIRPHNCVAARSLFLLLLSSPSFLLLSFCCSSESNQIFYLLEYFGRGTDSNAWGWGGVALLEQIEPDAFAALNVPLILSDPFCYLDERRRLKYRLLAVFECDT